MRRTFSPKRNALFSSADLSWGAWALVLAVLLLVARLIAPDFFWRTMAPVLGSADALSARSHAFFSRFADASRLALENESLRSDNDTLRRTNEALEKNNDALSALGAQERDIIASVVARPPESPYDALVLAVGTEDGVALGMIAFAAPTVPIGTVSSVTEHFSRVTLFSAPGVSTAAWVGDENFPVTLLGQGSGAMRATLPRSAPVSVGDIVYAPGPSALPLGRVARIDEEASSPSLTLHLSSLANLFSTPWVALRDLGSTFAREPLVNQATQP